MAPRKKKSEKPIFKNCVIALAGDLGKSDWTDDQLHKWISLYAGVYFGRIDQAGHSKDERPTHVLATDGLYKKMTQTRKKRLKKEGASIVSWEWLEDSISSKKHLKENDFRLDKLEKKEATKKKKKEKEAKGIELVEKGGVNNILNRPYTDPTFFKYDIMLTRTDTDTGMVSETWRVRIWESAGEPKLYHCAAEYNKIRGKKMHIRPGNSETPGSLEREMAAFRMFFAIKTGICWHERIVKAQESRQDLTTFTYEPPTGGKPVGEIEDVERRSDQAAKDFEAVRFKAVKDKMHTKRHLTHGENTDQPPKRPCPGIPTSVREEDKKPHFAQSLRDLLEASHQPSTRPQVYTKTIQDQETTASSSGTRFGIPKEDEDEENTSSIDPGEEGIRQVEDADTTMDDHRGDLRDSVEPDEPNVNNEVGSVGTEATSTVDEDDKLSTRDQYYGEGMLGGPENEPIEDAKKGMSAYDESDKDTDAVAGELDTDKDDRDNDDADDADGEDGYEDEDEAKDDDNVIDEDEEDSDDEATSRPTQAMKTPRPTTSMKTPRPANYGSQALVDSQLAGRREDQDSMEWLNSNDEDDDDEAKNLARLNAIPDDNSTADDDKVEERGNEVA